MIAPDRVPTTSALFVSYASADRALAMEVCAMLEAQGIGCWIAPRDVAPGAKWDEAILDAIESASALLLILTAAANASPYVSNKVHEAFEKKKVIFTFRAEDIAAGKSLKFYLGRHHWIDAFGASLEQATAKVAMAASGLPGAVPLEIIAPAPARPRPARAGNGTGLSRRRLALGVGAVALVAASSATTWMVARGASGQSPPVVSRLSIRLPDTAPILGLVGAGRLAISPDGRQIAYVGGTAYINGGGPGNDSQLYRRALDRLEVEAVPGTDGASTPFFSPDGRWLGFRLLNVLKKVGAAGGLPSTIGETPIAASRGVTWTRDDQLLYGILGGDLWRFPATGGAATLGLGAEPFPARDEITRRFPVALPDGRTVLYVSLPRAAASFANGLDFSSAQIVAYDVPTGRRTVLLTGGFGPQYSPSGHLVFARRGSLYAVPLDLDAVAVRGDAVKVLDNVRTYSGNGYAEFVLASNGSLAYVPGRDLSDSAGGSSVVWVDRQGGVRPLVSLPSPINQWRLSPDGTRLLLHGNSAVSNIGVHDVARGSTTRITGDDAGNTSPLWSPDGTGLTYTRPDPAFHVGPYELVTRAVAGGGSERRLLERATPIAAQSWSPDGAWLAFTDVTAATASDIWLLGAGGGQPLPLVTSRAAERNPRFSPDGRWIAYQSDESGRDEIYVRAWPAAAGGNYQVSSDGGTTPEWAPGGRELVYRRGNAVMTVAVRAGAGFAASRPAILFERHPSSVLLGVAPGGNAFMMTAGTDTTPQFAGSSEIVLIQNWAEELKRLVPVN
jgi:serine/threonine-protein kinase